MAETTQNELIAKPSSLSSHRKLNGIAQLLRPCMCVCVRACTHVRLAVKYPFSVCVENC